MDNENILLVCAFRYALGRRTYVVGVVAGEIHRNWTRLRDSDRDLIVREILEYQARYGNLGHACDEQEWMSIVERYKAEQEASV